MRADYVLVELQSQFILRRKIADLKRMERMLAVTVARCEGGAAPDGPIIDVLDQDQRGQP